MTGRGLVCLLAAASAGACARTLPAAPTATSTAAQCAADEAFDGDVCRPLGAGRDDLERGARALAEFQAREAIETLERARLQGPHTREEYARIYENLGIAYAYLDREDRAIEAFEMLLALLPGHAISYTLSPKATFLFERARERAASTGAPQVRVTWPRGVKVDDPLPLEIEVVSDPQSFLQRARLHTRREGEEAYQHIDFELSAPGDYDELVLPPLAAGAQREQVVHLYLSGFDAGGNEVYRWESPERPAEVPLDYRPPVRWYRNGWILAIGAAAASTAAGVTVYAFTREPSATVGGSFTAR
jgi:tetratricopeptide (TPR) repeat protein